MSAFDPKRTSLPLPERGFLPLRCPVVGLGGGNATARVHCTYRWRGHCTATRCVRAADTVARLFQQWLVLNPDQKSGGVSQRSEGGRVGRGAERCDRVRLGGKS